MGAAMSERSCDLRSDTVTQPTAAMRRSVLDAELGDDAVSVDPTVERLQDLAATLLGKEAALFVTSGTMANLLAVATHCQPGDEVILGEGCHIFNNEGGGSARVAAAQLRPLPDPGGRLDPEQIRQAIRPPDIHKPVSRLVCTENTHNGAGGVVVPLEHLQAVGAVAREAGLLVHLDGARIFNAAVASGTPASQFAATADSVAFCLSKGLCCPAGALLCGTRAFVTRARRLRKVLGGGMRQVGFLAAPGLVALETMIDRLAEDHRRARRLAEVVAALPGARIDLAAVQTNIVYFAHARLPAREVVQRLADAGVEALAFGPRVRLVTHHDIGDEELERACLALQRVLG
jgi:threonine aldolase